MKNLKTYLQIIAAHMCGFVVLLSFLLFTACANFENKTNEVMSQTINIPGGEVQLSGNPIWVETTTTTTGMTNHQILLKVTSTDGKVPGGPWVDHIQPVDGAARFDISGLVDYEFDYTFDYQHNSESFLRNLLMAQFSVQVGEYYVDGTGAEQENYSATENITVLKGELDKYEIARLSAISSGFFDHYIYEMRFLSKMNFMAGGDVKAIRVNQPSDPVKAWFLVLADSPNQIQTLVQCTDGDIITVVDDWWGSTDQFVELNCGVLADQANAENKEIDFYEISILRTNGIYGIIHVDVLNKHSENHEVLYCLNNLGAVEALNFYAEIRESKNIEKSEYTQAQSISPTLIESTLKSRRTGRTENFKINSGYKSLDERRWIAGLLECEKAWLKSERLPHLPGKNYGFVPVVVEPGSFEIDTTSEDLMSIEIELKIAHN